MCRICRSVQRFVHRSVNAHKDRGVLPARRRVLSSSQISNLLEEVKQHCSPMIYDAACVVAHAGLRSGELQLRWDAIDWGRRVIRLEDAKSTKGREIPISPALFTVLKTRRHQDRRAEKIFDVSRDSLRHQVSKALATASERLGWERVRLHDLRRSFIANSYISGVPIGVILRMAGLSTRQYGL